MSMLASPDAQLVALPLLAALLLAAIPAWRVASYVNLGAAVVTLLLACRLPFMPADPGWLLADGLAVHLGLLTSFVAVAAAWFSLFHIRRANDTDRLDDRRLRIYHALFQAITGFTLLALLSDNAGLTWIGIEAALLCLVAVTALPGTPGAVADAWTCFRLCGPALLLALFGAVVLYLAASPVLGAGWDAMRWSALAGAAPRMNGALLNLAFVLLLVGYATQAALAPLHTWAPGVQASGPMPASAILSGTTATLAVLVLLRLRGVMSGAAATSVAMSPGPLLEGLGLLSVLLAAFLLWTQRDARRFLAMAGILQTGVAVFAFGIGGPVATFAGLLHITLATLLRTVAFTCAGLASRGTEAFPTMRGLLAGRRSLALAWGAGIVALSGLPPFGVFASEFLIVIQTIQRAPWLAAPLGLGLAIGGWAMLARLLEPSPGAKTADAPPPVAPVALWPVWLQLAMVIGLGFAMPDTIETWLRGIATVAGAGP